MTTLLVTGGLGFIGSNFVLYWLGRHPQDRIINLDAHTYAANEDNVKAVSSLPNYRLVKGDIADPNAVGAVFSSESIDIVVHFAAESHVDRSILDPQSFVRTNVLGTQLLLEAARQAGVRRFIHVSTDEVYGTLGAEGAFTEQTPLAPNSPYSASKAGSDFLVRAYWETYRFPATITRCSNNYGPRQHSEKLIPTIITKAMKEEAVPIYGDGRNVRDWLFVEDHCSAIECVIGAGRPGQVYNIGGHNERTNMEIARAVLEQLGKPLTLIKHVADRPGHDFRYAINPDKITRELGWKPRYTLEQGLERTIAWYRALLQEGGGVP